MRRFVPLVTGHIYHVFNKSIYAYTIFNNAEEYQRMMDLILYYQWKRTISYSIFERYRRSKYNDLKEAMDSVLHPDCSQRVHILAWCVMPTHLHFILKQTTDNGIEHFMRDIQNGYTQFFNQRHNRKGPLWQNRFGSGHALTSDLELAEKIDYVLMNPVKDLGCPSPEAWPYSQNRYTPGECSG